MTTPLQGPMERALDGWGAAPPDWIIVLAQACANTSQNRVAMRLSRSASLVSAVLARRYSGDMGAVEDRVRGVFMSAEVDCPALGQTPRNICQDWQKKSRTFSSMNSARVQMFRACRRCPINQAIPRADAGPFQTEGDPQ